MDKPEFIIGTDTGGTFTDIVVMSPDGQCHINKAPTTPHNFSIGVMDAVTEVARDMGLTRPQLLSRCLMFKHGSTVGTNALITMTGSRVGFITTAGFEDTTLIMRAVGRVDGLDEDTIKHMAAPTKPDPIAPRDRIRGVRERVDYAGRVVVPLNLNDARESIRYLVDEAGVDALAISLLFGWVNPVHEQALKALVAEMYPDRDLFVSVASELVPVVREYARANTVIINSFLGKTVSRYLASLEQQLQGEGYPGALLTMQANGGIAHRAEASAMGTVSSGPAGGMIGSNYMADLLGHRNVITTDMGGTSFDVGLVTDGFWQYAREPLAGRFRVIQPMIDVESIGAGGGTIAHIDPETNRLLLGPRSAAAVPGPACYGAGGENPTVTDANVVLGLIDPDYFLGGRKRLLRDKAEEAIRIKVAEPLGLSVQAAAAGIHEIINSHMCDLIRKKVVRAGHVPEEFVIYSFGGAGPVHCALFAQDLGIKEVLVFPTSAVFSAFGIAAADIIHTYTSSYRYFLPSPAADLNRRLADIENGLLTTMVREGFAAGQVSFRRSFHMRYHRQVNELALVVPTREYSDDDVVAIMRSFDAKYEEVYGKGSSYPEAGTELVSMTVDAIGRTPKPVVQAHARAAGSANRALKGRRLACHPGRSEGYVETLVYDYQRLQPEDEVHGPAIIETPVTTIVVPPGNLARIDPYLNVWLQL